MVPSALRLDSQQADGKLGARQASGSHSSALSENAFYGSAAHQQRRNAEQYGKLDLVAIIRQHMSLEEDLQLPRGFLDPHNRLTTPSEALTPGMRMIVDVPRCVLQLLAVACVLLAAKDLEVVQPTVSQLCAVTANHFKPQDLLRMERIVLDVLEFRLSSPSSYTFLHLLAQMCSSSVTPSVLSVAMYICELATLEYDMHRYRHSCRAAAALLVGQLTLQQAAYHHNVAAAAAAVARFASPAASFNSQAGGDPIGDLLNPLRGQESQGLKLAAFAPQLQRGEHLTLTW
eukprot:gene10141-10299_t